MTPPAGSLSFEFQGEALCALPSGALFWPGTGVLCVSDLHLGKSNRMARRGGALLPPYETQATLARLDADLTATAAKTVICLGDSFDDQSAEAELPEPERLWLLRLMAGRDWIWIAGNHDPAPLTLGGSHVMARTLGRITFRHIADPKTPQETGPEGSPMGEVSGHFHPKARLSGRARPCFLLDAQRLILPAFGTYTGGLWADDPALRPLFGANARAILTGARCLAIPMPKGPSG
jgi:uncharacterized protein